MTITHRVYMDDSGNVDPRTTNEPDVRYGSISAVVLSAGYLDSTFNESFRAVVKRHFGEHEDGRPHNLHRRVLVAPPEQGPFAVLRNPDARQRWDADALRMFSAADYRVITACVDKVEWYWRYPTWKGDFYEVLVQAVLERAFYFLRACNGVAEVNIEEKSRDRDQRIKAMYRDALENGLPYINAGLVRQRFSSSEINILSKSQCKPGAQLADLLAGPSMQNMRSANTGRHPVSGHFVSEVCRILNEEKYYRDGGRLYGCVWRPKPQS